MSVAIESFASIFRPRDSRTRAEWGEEYVKPPGSARSTSFSSLATPWMVEPINYSADNAVKEQVLLMPTGSGKTTLLDCLIPHSIVEDPGGILLILQTDPDAREYVEERLMPILRGASPVEHILAGMDRHAIRKDCVMFPHLPLYMSGAKLTALQRRSVRYFLGDEVWRWKHGLVGEGRARIHDRWNGRIVLVSQGGLATIDTDQGPIETELEHAWQRTDRREWCFQCPQCGEVQRFRFKALHYEKGDSHGAIDENAIGQSARYVCAGTMREQPTCDGTFSDTRANRRMLANSGRYVAQNPTHLARHHGWHCNALTLDFVSWAQLAVEHANAMRALSDGDETRIRIYRQKRGAENYREQEQAQESALTVGDYTFSDYANGELWPGEAVRIMAIDVQRGHFWASIRAWKADGSSRRLWAAKVNTKEALREKQQAMKVKDGWVFIDSKYDTNTVYNTCGEYGWRALQGDGNTRQFRFNPKGKTPNYRFYSPISYVRGTSNKTVWLIFWAVLPVKRILEQMRGGYYRAPWEVEKDMDPLHYEHLFSEIEKDVVNPRTKAISRLFVCIKKNKNHLWDTSSMEIVGALIAGMLTDRPDDSATPEAAATVSIDTSEAVDGES